MSPYLWLSCCPILLSPPFSPLIIYFKCHRNGSKSTAQYIFEFSCNSNATFLISLFFADTELLHMFGYGIFFPSIGITSDDGRMAVGWLAWTHGQKLNENKETVKVEFKKMKQFKILTENVAGETLLNREIYNFQFWLHLITGKWMMQLWNRTKYEFKIFNRYSVQFIFFQHLIFRTHKFVNIWRIFENHDFFLIIYYFDETD